MTLDITSVSVHRVLMCLDEPRTKKDLLIRYGQLFPPTYLERIFSPKRQSEIEVEVSRSVFFLITSEYVKTEVISFTDRALRVPLVKYSLTPKGQQELSGTKKK